jgi:N-acetylmuramoyl-L-alanine amidase
MLKISVRVGGETEYLSYISRNGMTYASAIELSHILGGTYYYNDDAVKVDMKFSDYRLKITGRNQFIIITSRKDNSQSVYQLPISTLLMRDDVFIPLKYALPYLQIACKTELKFDDDAKHIVVTNNVLTSDTPKPALPDIDKPVLPAVSQPKINVDSKFDIYGLMIEEKTNGTLIRLKAQKTINKFSSSIVAGKLRLFISGATVDANLLKGFKATGFVRKAELKDVKGNKQIEFALNEGYSTHETIKDMENDDIIVTIHSKVFSNFEKDSKKDKKEWNFDVVVIDAGHGGKDGGAVGVTGVKEKDVNLKIALELGKIIREKMPEVKVVYTREKDEFVELFKRGKIANENNGKLFVSIHCNSLKQKGSSIRGFEVYLLRPGRTQKAIEIAEFENSVIDLEDNPNRYQELTDENFILVSMAHSAYMRYSEKFSDLLNKNWIKGVNQIPSRGVKQAGFYVLVGASMPGALIETGFLSNPKDEKYLNSSRGQKEIANSIFSTIKEYKTFYNAQIDAES